MSKLEAQRARVDLLAGAELMGSRGRARAFGRSAPANADFDWMIFVEDAPAMTRWIAKLLQLSELGYTIVTHPDGCITASSAGEDFSVCPLIKRAVIYQIWTRQEEGLTKEEAWAEYEGDMVQLANDTAGLTSRGIRP